MRGLRGYLLSAGSGASVRRCLPVAVFVGTILSLVNQGALIVGGDATGATWARIAANFAVPFLVSSYGFWSATPR
jgi:hypothetical protein